MKIIYRAICLAALCMTMHTADAQDFGIVTSVGAEKKITKKWDAGAEVEFRTRDDSQTADRWSFGLSTGYKVLPWLKASAGYTLLSDNNDKTTYKSNGEVNKQAEFWGTRHRFNVALTAAKKFGRMRLSLRERWQYTYRPEKTVQRYDVDDEEWESKTYRGKGKNVLRSRLQLGYKISKTGLTPYVASELFNAWNIQKVRYTGGAEWNITKHHQVELFYRYQHISRDDDDNDGSRHYLGIGYQYRF